MSRLTATELWNLARVGRPTVVGGTVVVPITTYDIDDNEGTTALHLVDGEDLRPLTADGTAPLFSGNPCDSKKHEVCTSILHSEEYRHSKYPTMSDCAADKFTLTVAVDEPGSKVHYMAVADATDYSSANAAPVTDPTLEQIKAGVDYTALRDLLKAGEWEEADNEHRRLMCVLAGEDAEDRGWVYFTEVKQFPVKDLKTIDNLWTFYSDGKFGFSVQRKIWIGKKRQWAKFFKEIDWVQGENNAYRKWPEEFIWKKEAKKGHMPLTNALRGTQLLNALLEHPAFAPPAKPKSAADQAAEAMEQMGDNLKKAMGGGMPGLKGLKKPSWMK